MTDYLAYLQDDDDLREENQDLQRRVAELELLVEYLQGVIDAARG